MNIKLFILTAVFALFLVSFVSAAWTPDAQEGECSGDQAMSNYDCTGACYTDNSRIYCKNLPSGITLGERWVSSDDNNPSCPSGYIATGFDCTGDCGTDNMKIICRKLENIIFGNLWWIEDKEDQHNCEEGFIYKFDCTGDCGTPKMKVKCIEIFAANNAPIASSVSLSPLTSYTNTILTCDGSATDVDNDPLTNYYRFSNLNGVLQDWSITNTFSCTTLGCDKNDLIYCDYRAFDGIDYSNIITSNTVTILNSAPSINIPDQIISEDSFPVIAINNLNTVANDLDNDILSFAVTSESLFVDCNIIGNALTLTPFPDFFGTNFCTVEADDGNGGLASSTFSIDVTGINDAPIIEGIPDQNLNENSGFNDNIIDLWAYSFDLETPWWDLVYTIISQTDTNIVDCVVDIDGFVDCTTQLNQIGYSDVTIEVSDGQYSDTDTFRVNVNSIPPTNNAPVWTTNILDLTLDEDFGNIIHVSNLLSYVTDADGDVPVFTVVNENPLEVNCEIISNQLILYSVLNYNGVTICTIRADDNNGGTADDTFSIRVDSVNDNPIVSILSPNDPSTFDYGDDIIFGGTANDVEDGNLIGSNLQWISNLDGNIGSGESFTIDSLSVGTHIITLTATDINSGTGTDSITININEEEEKEITEKEHDLKINAINLIPSVLDCGKTFTLNVEIENTGDYNEYVYLKIENTALEINEKSKKVYLHKNDEGTFSFNLDIPKVIEEGSYVLIIKIYFNNRIDTVHKTVNVECKKTETKESITEEVITSTDINVKVRTEISEILQIIGLVILILLLILIITYIVGKI